MIPGVGNKILIKTTTATTLKTGLVSVWELDEASGTTAYDSHGTNHGTTNNAVVNQTASVLNKCYTFDGTGDYINIGDITGVDFGSGDYSYECWIYPTSFTTRQQVFSKDVSTGRQFNFEINPDLTGIKQGYIQYASFNTNSSYYRYYTSAAVLTKDAWNHVVITKNASVLYLYVNNVNKTFTIANGPITSMQSATSDLYIGGRQYSGYNDYFVGNITRVAVWNKVLTTEEVSLLYNGGNGLPYTSW